MDEEQRLIELRDKLVGDIGFIAESAIDDPSQRFSLIMLRARNTADPELLAKASDCAHQIEDPNEKTEALLKVIEEIDYILDTNHSPAEENNSQDLVQQE